MVFPRREFEKASCKDANVEKGLIVDMFNKIDAEKWNLHSLILVKNGAKVFDAYAKGFGPNQAEDVYSISKSFTAIAIGICQDLKLLKTTDKVLPFFEKELNGQFLPEYEQLKVEHLLTMSSGQQYDGIEEFKNGKDPYITFFNIPVVHDPGTVFMYNNLGTYLLSAIITKVSGHTVNDLLQIHLYPKLDIEKPFWVEKLGNSLGCSGLRMSVVDLAKFGLLLLNEGKWRDDQIVSGEFVRNATKYHISTANQQNPKEQFGYGYQIWMNGFGDYRLSGKFKQLVIINKEFQTVFAVQAYEEREVVNLFSEFILPSLQKGWLSDNYTLRVYLARFTEHSYPQIEAEKVNRK